MTINKEFLDRVIPDNPHSTRVAAQVVGKRHFVDNIVCSGLQWLINVTEHDEYRSEKPDWYGKPGMDYMRDWWPISVDGLNYKKDTEYLTLEGWPLGTRCWYVRIETGWNEFFAADTMECAIVRAIIYVDSYIEWRKIKPKERPDIEEIIERRMKVE